jgi:NADPH:quinone reductase-like Zn-dependent oxidoreductase
VGCWQEVALVPAAAASRRPAAVTGIDAGGMPVCAVTAYQGLVELLDLKPSETLLVTGGGGALGSQAVQLGGWIGARVITTASAEDHDRMGELGASDALDYRGPWLERLRDLAYDGVDVVFDTVGGDVMTEASHGVRDRGRIVTSVRRQDGPLERGVTWRFFASQGTTARLTTLAGLVDAASLVPTTGAVFPLEDVRDAVAAQLAPHRGKVVLTLG